MTQLPADILRNARQDRGFETAAEAARYFGWGVSTYTSHENGVRGIRKDAAKKYAAAYGISLESLLGLSSPRSVAHSIAYTPIVGEAAQGVWREVTLHSSITEDIPIPLIGAEGAPQKALLISDNTVNRSLAIGDYAVYKDITHDELELLKVGQLVVINRSMTNLIEITIKRVSSCENGTLRLTTHAKSGDLYRVDSVPIGGAASDESDLEVVGLVVGSYRPII